MVPDRREARRLLGMVGAHVVPEAFGMRYKGSTHHERSYPMAYNRRGMLPNKAEIAPQSVLQGPIERAIEAAGGIILGKEQQVRLALACLPARGHLLIQEVPVVGKTTLAHVLVRSLGLTVLSIQI